MNVLDLTNYPNDGLSVGAYPVVGHCSTYVRVGDIVCKGGRYYRCIANFEDGDIAVCDIAIDRFPAPHRSVCLITCPYCGTTHEWDSSYTSHGLWLCDTCHGVFEHRVREVVEIESIPYREPYVVNIGGDLSQ